MIDNRYEKVIHKKLCLCLDNTTQTKRERERERNIEKNIRNEKATARQERQRENPFC
jgi:hypothetical protein